jgi:hypothetical protein
MNNFETVEIRRATNGFILIITDEDGDPKEYVYDTSRKLMRVLKPILENGRTINTDT